MIVFSSYDLPTSSVLIGVRFNPRNPRKLECARGLLQATINNVDIVTNKTMKIIQKRYYLLIK